MINRLTRNVWQPEFEAAICSHMPQARLLWKVLGNQAVPLVMESPALKIALLRAMLETVKHVDHLIPGYGVRCSRKMLRENEEYRILRGIK